MNLPTLYGKLINYSMKMIKNQFKCRSNLKHKIDIKITNSIKKQPNLRLENQT